LERALRFVIHLKTLHIIAGSKAANTVWIITKPRFAGCIFSRFSNKLIGGLNMTDCIKITVQLAPYDTPNMILKGRNAWCLNELIKAKDKGCTPIERPAPRWSEYIRCLREVGINIETIYEPHGGAYSGTHGRYVLRTKLRVIPEQQAA
jgi:hypothetical protein